MARTTVSAVQGVLGANYNGSSTSPTPLGPYIETATSVVSRVATCAASRNLTLSSTELELIERWLAAYFYTVMDPLFIEEETGRARAVYAQRSYLEAATQSDPSGCLKLIMCRKIAGVKWLGRPPSEQTDYSDRD